MATLLLLACCAPRVMQRTTGSTPSHVTILPNACSAAVTGSA